MIVYGFLLGAIAGYARGGGIRAIGAVRLRAAWLVFLAFLLQFLIFPSLLLDSPPLLPFQAQAHIITYGLAVVFVGCNWRLLRPIVPGMAANILVIAANGGYMPASVEALRRSSRSDAAEALAVSAEGTLSNVVAMSEATRLNVLGDWLWVPPTVPFSTAFSIGDVLIVVGIAWIVQTAMRLQSSPGEAV